MDARAHTQILKRGNQNKVNSIKKGTNKQKFTKEKPNENEKEEDENFIMMLLLLLIQTIMMLLFL